MVLSSIRGSSNSKSGKGAYAEGVVYSRLRAETPLDDQQYLSNSSSLSTLCTKELPRLEPLGVPTVKKRFPISHTLIAIVSLICLALAITVVATEKVSWLLGRQNYQLIIVGFLLSIMNISLNSIAPRLFLHFEARYGPSTL